MDMHAYNTHRSSKYDIWVLRETTGSNSNPDLNSKVAICIYDIEIMPPKQRRLRILRKRLKTDPASSRFKELATQWKEESKYMSSVTDMATLQCYQNIIGMGHLAVPLILRELQEDIDHWFWALKAITSEDPVPESARGNIKEMASCWIKWGQLNSKI